MDGASLENVNDPKGIEKPEPGLEALSLATIRLHQLCIQHLRHHQPCCLIVSGTRLSMSITTEPAAEPSQTARALGMLWWFSPVLHKLGSGSEPGQVCLPTEHMWVAG